MAIFREFWAVFTVYNLKNRQIFFARAFGARDIFHMYFEGGAPKNMHL